MQSNYQAAGLGRAIGLSARDEFASARNRQQTAPRRRPAASLAAAQLEVARTTVWEDRVWLALTLAAVAVLAISLYVANL